MCLLLIQMHNMKMLYFAKEFTFPLKKSIQFLMAKGTLNNYLAFILCIFTMLTSKS